MTKFIEGQVVRHKASDRKFVILKVLRKRWFRKRQKYVARWFSEIRQESHGYSTGRVYENELYEIN